MIEPQVIAAQYRYAVNWSEPDQAYVATVAEFPSLSYIDNDKPWHALNMLRSILIGELYYMHKENEALPVPLIVRERYPELTEQEEAEQ